MPGSGLRPLLACFTLALACGDTNPGSTSAGSTSAASTGTTTGSSTGTTPDTSSTATPTSTASASATASSSSGEPPTTGTVDSTSTSTTGTVDPSTTSTTTTDSTTSTSDPGTSTGPGSSTGGGNIEPPPPTMPAGCNSCSCCDPWPISWAAVPEATHYVVRWKCSVNPEQVHDVGPKTAIADVCNDIAMCNGMCAFTVGYIKVQACNDDGCSALVDIPADQAPITCGGGCCC